MSEAVKTTLMKKLMPTLNAHDAEANWHITGPVFRARKCDIYKVTGANQQFAVKVYKAGVTSKATPKIQYEALQRCNHAAKRTPLIRAPIALAFIPDQNAILMTWHDTPTLRTALWRNVAAPKQRLTIVSQSAAWLRAFHSLSENIQKPLDGSKLSVKLETQIKKKPEAQALLKNSTQFQHALSCFHNAVAKCSETTPHALLHGDFTPSNLLADGENIVGMDMWGARHAPVYEDITRMLAYLGVVSPYCLYNAPLAPDGPLLKTFMRGYGTKRTDIESRAFTITLLYQQLRRWLVYADKKAKQPHSLAARWQERKSRHLCMQTNTWLDKC